eukprot:384809-Amphidinium_carterae.1
MDILAASSAGPSKSLWESWKKLHLKALPDEPVLPLTPAKLYTLGALLKAAEYRSVNMMYRARKEHLLQFDWSERLQTAFKDTRRSIQRGLGPPRQSAALDLTKLSFVDTEEPLVPSGPVNPRA